MSYGRNRVFIGGISSSVTKDEIDKEFGKFGKLVSVWVAQNPPGFAFVEYDDARDADEAVRSLNGQALFSDNRIRVEHSKGESRRSSRGGGRGGSSSGGYRDGSSRGYSSGGGGSSSYGRGGRGYKSSSGGGGRYDDRPPRSGGRYGEDRGGSSSYESSRSMRDRYDGPPPDSYGGYRSRSPIGHGGRRSYGGPPPRDYSPYEPSSYSTQDPYQGGSYMQGSSAY